MAIGKKALERIGRGLDRYHDILAAAKKRDVSESDTVVIIGDMLADIMGYEKYVDVSTEFAVKGSYVDLAVKAGNDIQFLIEAKAIGVELKDQHVRQAVDYGANQGVEWAILTNGAVWRIYKIEFKKPISHALVAEIDLLAATAKPDDVASFFANLCKEGFAKSQMEEFYEQHQATNKFTLAALLLTEGMIDVLRRTIRRHFPGADVDNKALDLVLRNEVLKRELLEGDDAEMASALVRKAQRAAARKKRVAKPAAAPANAPAAAPALPVAAPGQSPAITVPVKSAPTPR